MMLFLKNLLFTVLVPGTVGVYLPLAIASDGSPAPGGWLVFGVALLGLGSSIYLWCLWDFASFGRGTPAPIDAPKRLVVRGLYRCSRNPMYVGVLSAILGWAALFRSPSILLYALFVGSCFHLFVRFYEEPHLHATFGSDYEDYCARVARWVPRRLTSE
jgi:protein-S-isoprenylcysteine O-methyltransferase Ste14